MTVRFARGDCSWWSRACGGTRTSSCGWESSEEQREDGHLHSQPQQPQQPARCGKTGVHRTYREQTCHSFHSMAVTGSRTKGCLVLCQCPAAVLVELCVAYSLWWLPLVCDGSSLTRTVQNSTAGHSLKLQLCLCHAWKRAKRWGESQRGS